MAAARRAIGFIRRREVELGVAGELFAMLLTVFLLTGVLLALPPTATRIALLVIVVVIATSTWRSWRVRTLHHEHFLNWQREPLQWTGSVVVQQNDQGETTGTIDPRGHYSVRWQKFSAHRALYLVTQDDQTIRISTLAPNAPEILKDRLRVANYPCEEWPNLDL